MTRSITVPVTLALLLWTTPACQPGATPCTPGDATARCGTAVGPGETPLRPGADYTLFTAENRQTITLKQGASLQPERDEQGMVRGVTVMALDNSPGITLRCQCPSGCVTDPDNSGPLRISCAVAVDPDDPGTAFCGGDCFRQGACCAGCGWVEVPD
jgi:hypothetical protein